MSDFVIIETEQGLTIAELPGDSDPVELAAQRGAVLIDPGPFRTYEEAYDALLAASEDSEDETA